MKFDQLRKVNSISIDTNVLLDLPEVPLYENARPRTDAERKRQERVLDSYKVMLLCLAENISVTKIGIKVVEKELCKTRWLLPIYFSLFPNSAKPDKFVKRLAGAYMGKLDIGEADAMLLAVASARNIDVFLSWNREDISNANTQKAVESINTARKISTPLLCTPTYFLDRVIGSEGKKKRTLALSPSPVPPAYRLKFFPSK